MKRASLVPTLALTIGLGIMFGVAIEMHAAVPTIQLMTAVDDRQDQAKDGRATPEEIANWIEQLSDGSLTKRRKAKEALVLADAAAIPLLAKAALSEQRELIVYSLEVLGTLLDKSPSEETRQTARITLQMLAESDQPSTADRAKQILGTKADQGIEAFPGWDDPNSGFSGGLPGANRSVSVSSVNGMKTIRIEEDARVTVFRDEPRGAIRVTIQDGDKKTEFVAKTAEELKKKDAAAHALYEEHSNGVGGIAAFAGGFPGGFAGNEFPGLLNGGNVIGGAVGGVHGAQQQAGNMGRNQIRGGRTARQVGGPVGNERAPRRPANTDRTDANGPTFDQPPTNEPRLRRPEAGGRGTNLDGDGSPLDTKAMMISQLEELQRRMADHPEMARMLDAQIQLLKQDNR